MTIPRLPVELIELVINFASQYDQVDPVVLDGSSDAYKTLRSCIQLCKATYSSVQKLLYQKCLYLTSDSQIRALLRSYDTETVWGLKRADKLSLSHSMYLRLFQGEDGLHEPQTIESVARLFGVLRLHLRRLIINMPLRDLYPGEEYAGAVRPPLRAAFEQLGAIEEFVSVQDELFLQIYEEEDEQEVWGNWKTLRHLALYNPEIDDRFWLPENRLPHLKTLVLVRPDFGVPDCWEQLTRALGPTVKILAVNARAGHERYFASDDLELSDHLMGYEGAQPPDVPTAEVKAYCVDDGDLVRKSGGDPVDRQDIGYVQAAVEKAALDGTLWKWRGGPLFSVLPRPLSTDSESP